MAKRQVIGIIGGFLLVSFICLIDYHFICKFAPLYYVIALIMLVMVKFTSYGVDHGTRAFRWLNLANVLEIQPSELVKIILIIVLSVLFSKLQTKLYKWRYFFLSIVVVMVPTFLILIQTDLSSSIVCIFVFTIMIFIAGLSLKIIGTTILVLTPVVIFLFWYVLQPTQKLLSDYQRGRILSFLNPEKYALTLQYQQINSVRAIASGKVLGKTILGDPSNLRFYNKVWVNESDFIFSVVAEEFGFIGCFILITLFSFIVFKCLSISRKAQDFTGKMIAIGVSAMLMFQMFVNIGVATALLPNTGLPLPFLSYGLSSLLSSLLGIALVLNVGIHKGNNLSFNASEGEIFF